jgi:hypothetical protein
MDGYLKQIICNESSNQINAFSFNDNFLYILHEASILECWMYVSEENIYSNKIHKNINNCNDVYSDMCYFTGKWIFSSCITGRLTILLN